MDIDKVEKYLNHISNLRCDLNFVCYAKREILLMYYALCNTKDMKVKFSENLKFLREQNNKTQKDIADLCKTTTATVSRWENGVNEPDIYTLILLADFFDITVDELIK